MDTSFAPSLALFTDLYELTMAQAYWQAGRTELATFSLFFRSYPPDRAFFVSAGLTDVLDYLENLQFSAADLAYLRSLRRFDHGFLDYLASLRFTGSVRAMPEGTIAFANEPLLEVTAPIIEGQIAETYLVNQVNLQTTLATKAARVVHAARGKTVVDFAARRTHGVEAADKLARLGYLVGFAGTSNVAAGARYGIPVSGTMAHSFVTSFPSELEAFRQFARSFPDTCTLLVDSYDTLQGVRHAIIVAQELRQAGHRLQGLRLDSGDLLSLSRQARALLDDARLHDVQIFASGGLDEYGVDDLLRGGAPIDGFGVGTKVGVSADAPWTDCVYKLVEYAGQPVLKLSTGKQTLPGRKQVFRRRTADGQFERDVIACDDEPPPTNAEAMLVDVMVGGKRIRPVESLTELRRRFQSESAALPKIFHALRSPPKYEVAVSERLQALQQRTSAAAAARELSAPHEQHPR